MTRLLRLPTCSLAIAALAIHGFPFLLTSIPLFKFHRHIHVSPFQVFSASRLRFSNFTFKMNYIRKSQSLPEPPLTEKSDDWIVQEPLDPVNPVLESCEFAYHVCSILFPPIYFLTRLLRKLTLLK